MPPPPQKRSSIGLKKKVKQRVCLCGEVKYSGSKGKKDERT